MSTSQRKISYQDEEEGDERDSDLMSDFSDEQKRHKDLKSKFKGQRQQKVPLQITQLIGDANYKYFLSNQIEEAIEIAQDIIRQYPTFTDPYDLLGTIFEEQGLLKEAAEQQFLAAYQMNSSASRWEKIAQLYKEAKCYDSAGYCFGRVLKSDTLNTSLWCERAKCYEQTGELKKAIKCFERVIKMDSNNFDAIKNCAKVDKSEESVRLLKSMVKADDLDKNYNIINMICEIYNRKQQYEDLCNFLEEYCGVGENNELREQNLDELPLAILIFFAVAHQKIHHKDESELGFRLIMKREMEESEGYISIMEELADIYEGAQETQKALIIYQRLTELTSTKDAVHQPIWEKYGILLLKQNKNEDTLKIVEEIIQKYPDSIDLRTELSAVYHQLGRDNDSLKILENIIKNDMNVYGQSYDQDLADLAAIERNDNNNNNIQGYGYNNQQENEDSEEIFNSEEDEEDNEDEDGRGNKQNLFDNIYLYDRDNKKKRFIEEKIDNNIQIQGKFVEDQIDESKGNNNNNNNNNTNEIGQKQSVQKQKRVKTNKQRMDDKEDDEHFGMDKYHLKDFFEQTQSKKNHLAENYSVKTMFLEYKKSQIILSHQQISHHKLENQFQALKNSLKLEKEYNNLKKSVMNRLLIESQKKGFQRKLTTPNNLKSFDNPNQTLLIKKKRSEEQEILLKKKYKKSEELTSQYLKNVEVLSMRIGSEPYLKYIVQMLKVLLKYECYVKISKICALAHRLHIWRDPTFAGYHETIAKYGLLSALKLQNFDKAFTFIKLLVNKNSDRLYLQVILCIVLRRISNVNIYKTFLSRMVKKSSTSPKFLPIIACGFLETGNFDLAIDAFLAVLKNDQANSLHNLSLGVCYAQLTTARTTFDKEQVAAKAVHYMQAYQQSRGASKVMEVAYNLGRFFIHLSMNDKAIEHFEQCMSIFESRNIKGAYAFNQKNYENDVKIHSSAVYNLIVLHKNLGNHSIAHSLLKSYCALQ